MFAVGDSSSVVLFIGQKVLFAHLCWTKLFHFKVVNQSQHQSITSVFCLLVKCSVKITSSCIFRHSSCVPTSSETWGMYFVCTVLRLILPFCNSNLFKHGALRMRSRSNWNFEELVFEERGKPEYPKKKPLGARERNHHCATLAPPVSTTIQILILQTDLHIFPLRIFEKI